jgi:phosphatidylserine/phosphatidylglycerophosphate/cardiolipin synthase-like enzyme
MITNILTNNEFRKLIDAIPDYDKNCDNILIASAFFSYNDLIESWLKLNKNISLLISLRPPTNYYSLKKIIHNRNIQIRFLGNKFHSKFIIFENTEIPLNSIIGSSNFTNGGLDQNIETNILVKDEGFSKDLKRHFIKLWNESFCLEPSDLEKYKGHL